MGRNNKKSRKSKEKPNATEFHPFNPLKTEVMEPFGEKGHAIFLVGKKRKKQPFSVIGQKMFKTRHFFLVCG